MRHAIRQAAPAWIIVTAAVFLTPGHPGWMLPAVLAVILASIIITGRINGRHRRDQAQGDHGTAGRARTGTGPGPGPGPCDCAICTGAGTGLTAAGLWQDIPAGSILYAVRGQQGSGKTNALAQVAAAAAYMRHVYGNSVNVHVLNASGASTPPGGQGSSNTTWSGASGGSGTGGAGGGGGASSGPAVTPGITIGGNGRGGAGGAGGGGLVSAWSAGGSGGAGGRMPFPRRGMNGFDDAEFVAGSVTGYRWWSLHAPDLCATPARADQYWPRGLLRGVQDYWQPGVNTAICKADQTYRHHPDSTIPDENCGCGYWAYWTLQHHQVGGEGQLPVCGVIEGSGNVLIGTKGFRCSRARITALHLPFSIQPQVPVSLERQLRAGGWDGRFFDYSRPAPPGTRITDADMQAAQAQCEAWMAVIGDRLAQLYPDAEVFETAEAMLARYLASPQYQEPPAIEPCTWCGSPVPVSERIMHAALCPQATRF